MAGLLKRVRETSRVKRYRKDPRFKRLLREANDITMTFMEEHLDAFDPNLVILPDSRHLADIIARLDKPPSALLEFLKEKMLAHTKEAMRGSGKSERQVTAAAGMSLNLLMRWTSAATLIYRGQKAGLELTRALLAEVRDQST